MESIWVNSGAQGLWLCQRAALFDTLPNLLDPRVNDGDDEEANFEVRARTAGTHR